MIPKQAIRNIAPNDYDQFRLYLESQSGIVLGDNKQYLVKSRLGGIFKQYDIANLKALTVELESNPRSGLKPAVIDAMTTHETSWFRDDYPYDILKRLVFSERAEKSRQLNIWCSACSTGQEPYSVSMAFDEWRNALRSQGGSKNSALADTAALSILATDLSAGTLSAAESGCFDEIAMKRGLSQERRRSFFEPIANDAWKVKNSVQNRVEFKLLNLLNSFDAHGPFDVVFCRNVLIYFSPDCKQDILRRIHQVLKPGGYLFLGGSESCTTNDLFDLTHCSPGIIYQAK